MVKLLLVQPKSLQECSIIFEDAAKAAALLPAQNIAQGSADAHALLIITFLRIVIIYVSCSKIRAQ